MRLVTYQAGEAPAVGILTGEGVHPTGHDDLLAVIRSGRLPEPAGAAITDARLLAPIPRPGKLLFCGVNYASHKEENPDAVLPAEPFFFSKLPTAVIGPDEPIRIPAAHRQVDYEVELAVVIGTAGRAIPAERASRTCSATRSSTTSAAATCSSRTARSRSARTSTPSARWGRAIVTADEIPDPSALTVSSRVNGELRQHEPTANMLFPVPALLEFVSRHDHARAGRHRHHRHPGRRRGPSVRRRPTSRRATACPWRSTPSAGSPTR